MGLCSWSSTKETPGGCDNGGAMFLVAKECVQRIIWADYIDLVRRKAVVVVEKQASDGGMRWKVGRRAKSTSTP